MLSRRFKQENVSEKMVIRPIRKKDFDQLFELVSKSFRKEIQITGLSVQRLSRLAKLYRLFEMLLPVFDLFHKDFDTILVAVSGGRLIGGIHLVPRGKKMWSLYSAAVDTMFRGHGVFRKLMKEALEYISKRHGERVFGSVRTDKIPVVKTFKKLKFEAFGKEILLQLELNKVPVVEFNESMLIREAKPADVGEVYQICKALSPKKTQVYKIAPGDFLDSFFSRMVNRMAWSYSKRWVMEINGRIVGYAQVTYTPPQKAGEILSFYVIPKSSTLISFLLSEVLRFLATRNVRKLTTSLDEEWRETMQVFERFGFKRIATVHEMAKDLI